MAARSRGRVDGIERQIRLPFSKAFEIAWKGVTVRIWRSLITMGGIVLAIAFLMSIWTSQAIVDSLKVVPEDDPYKEAVATTLKGHLTGSAQRNLRVSVLANPANRGGSRLSKTLLEDEQFNYVHLEENPSDLARGIHSDVDVLILFEIPEGLRDEKVLQAMKGYVEDGGGLIVIGANPVPTGMKERNAEGASFEDEFSELLPVQAKAETVRFSSEGLGAGRQPPAADVKWASFPAVDVKTCELRGRAKSLVWSGGGDASGALPVLAYRKVGRGRVLQLPLAHPTDGALLDWVEESGFLASSLVWTGERILKADSPETRLMWLVVLSLLVCVVGITNSMLMSVTERIREIGTMKCLGALDSFIVKLFVIESSLHGILGTVLGILLGFAAAFVLAFFKYSTLECAADAEFNPQDAKVIAVSEETLTPRQALAVATSQVAASLAKPMKISVKRYYFTTRYFPATPILKRAAVAWVIGAFLSVLAAIYPASRAAKMQPVDAMRVEE